MTVLFALRFLCDLPRGFSVPGLYSILHQSQRSVVLQEERNNEPQQRCLGTGQAITARAAGHSKSGQV